MDTPDSIKRKRYSLSGKKTPGSAANKSTPTHLSTEQSTSPISNPPKLIDQLYQTYRTLKETDVPLNQIQTSEKEQKLETSQISTSKQAEIELKQKSVEMKLSELKTKKAEFCRSQINKEKEQKFCVEAVNRTWEIVQHIYEDIKYILEKEGYFEQHFSNVSEIKTTIIGKLKEKSEKLEIVSIENLETEISSEKYDLENFIKTRWNVKEKLEKLQESDEVCSVNNVEQKLDNIKGFIKALNDEEIGLENVLQEKTDQNLKMDSKFFQDQQELETMNVDLENELKDFNNVDEMQESANQKIKQIISMKLNLVSDIENDFTEEIQQMQVKLKELELKLSLQKASVDLTNQFQKLENRLIDSKNAINLISSENIDGDNLDKSLMEVNKEFELLQSEQTSKEIELKNDELEALIREQKKNYEENAEILQELSNDITCEKEESIIRDLELDFIQKEKVRNEMMENYNNIKQVNNEQLQKNPNLLDTKNLQNFATMKKKSEAALNSAQQREKTLEKRYETKLKELEHKSKKYLAALKEIDQELSATNEKSRSHDFASLQEKIKEAEEKLQKKKDFQEKALPVITKAETVQIDMETLSLIKTLSKNLPEQPTSTLFSDDESLDSNVRFEHLSKLYKAEPVKFSNEQEKMKNNSEKDEYLFPLSQAKPLCPETELDQEESLFPLSQAKGLQSFSEEHSENPINDEYSFPLTQGKNEKPSSQTSFEYKKSPNNDQSFFSNSQTTADQPSSQRSFEYGSQKKEKPNVSHSQSKVETSKSTKERERITEKRFFKSTSQPISKSYKRSKSVPPRK